MAGTGAGGRAAARWRNQRLNQGMSGSRASSGPVTTVISTYAVASPASLGSTGCAAATASPAMTMENSPRG